LIYVCYITREKYVNIFYFLQVLTEKGVRDRNAKTAVTPASSENLQSAIHAGYEKTRRKGLCDCFHVLGATLMPEEQIRKTNRYDILQLVIIK
jgi:hypothetical protein